MPRQSAGILLYRKTNGPIEFFLVHPGGPFFARKHEGWWTVPKGELLPGEDPLAAAQREFREETGQALTGRFVPLTPVRQRGGKEVLCWAVEGDIDAAAVVSNTFELQWPPRSGRMQAFPEIDRAGWFVYEEARQLINGAQAALLDQVTALGRSPC